MYVISSEQCLALTELAIMLLYYDYLDDNHYYLYL